MIPQRYPAPGASALFADSAKLEHWRKITDLYAHQLIEDTFLSENTAESLHQELDDRRTPSPEAVATRELDTGHDVVAFLALYTQGMSERLRPYIHHGLTSSDLVEYGLHQTCAQHATHMSSRINTLMVEMARWDDQGPLIRPGRTHGQIADHTTFNHQLKVHRLAMRDLRSDFWEVAERIAVIKSPGPTGWPDGDIARYQRAAKVADVLNRDIVLATQVVHRDRLLQWATVYLRLACALENLALLVRLGARAEVREVAEGAARVGSSAMPHKQNPIDSEKVCGLARVARGYFTAISEDVALWEDRDLTNSSLERIAVPGLAATLEHMVTTMEAVMAALQVDGVWMSNNAQDPRTKTNIMQTAAQDVLGLGPVEAASLVRKGIDEDRLVTGLWQENVFDLIFKQYGRDLAKEWDGLVDIRFRARFKVGVKEGS